MIIHSLNLWFSKWGKTSTRFLLQKSLETPTSPEHYLGTTATARSKPKRDDKAHNYGRDRYPSAGAEAVLSPEPAGREASRRRPSR